MPSKTRRLVTRCVGSVLNRFGLAVVDAPQAKPLANPPSPAERALVDEIVSKFSREQADAAIGDPHRWKNYLSNHRLSFFADVVKRITSLEMDLSGKRVADFGSGTGYLLRLLNQLEPKTKLFGFDTFEEVNSLARMLCPSASIVCEDLESEGEPFDLIFCTEVLEHLVDPARHIKSMLDSVCSGGRLVLTVPDGRTDTHAARKKRDDGTAYWGHIHFWSPESWRLFIGGVTDGLADSTTDTLDSGQNIAIIQKK